MTKTNLSLFMMLGLSLMFALPVWADFQAGVDAFGRGDYETALAEFRALADQGNATAQYNLGQRYRKGQGVPQDDHEAGKWFRRAADQGMALAQNNLALMYYRGQGVPQDYVLAHMWANLAASQGGEARVEKRDAIATFMTPQQLAEAQQLAREWKAKGKE